MVLLYALKLAACKNFHVCLRFQRNVTKVIGEVQSFEDMKILIVKARAYFIFVFLLFKMVYNQLFRLCS